MTGVPSENPSSGQPPAADLAPGRPVVFRNATVLTMDDAHHVLEGADVLVQGERITAVGPGLAVPEGTAEIDATGGIVMPGMIDTHRHMWQTAMRGYGADWTLTQYFVWNYLQWGKSFRPQDIYAGNLLSAIEAIDAGVTTTVDWSHNLQTTEHAEAAVDALQEVPGRFVLAYGNIQAAPWEWSATPEFRDFVSRRLSGGSDMLGFQMAFDVPPASPDFPEKAAFEVARDLGVPVTTHAGVWKVTTDEGIRLMHEHGFMTESTVYVHAASLSADSYHRIAATGGSASLSTESEQSAGQGYPPTWKLRQHGIPVSLSMDTSVWWSADLFSAMRATLSADRAREHLEAHANDETVTHHRLRAEQVVDWATRGGAKALGLDSVTGSLEPGKKADIVLIKNDASPVMFPLLNPYGHVVFQAQRGDVHTVVINGRVVKHDHRLVGPDLGKARQAIEQTVSYLQGELGPEAWAEGMHPEIPETRVLDNPYTYTYTYNSKGPGPAVMSTVATGPADGNGAGGGAMRAAVLRRHGALPEPGPHPAPQRGPGQALIRVTAAPISPLDLLCASGTSYFGAPALPYVPGTQGVGVVEEADGLPAGQRVWFSATAGMRPGDGSMAQWCVVPKPAVLPVPDGVSDDLAAALGLSAIAAWMALTWRGGLQRGEHVLVLGASGNVGQIGVQAARLLGAGRVVAACRDPHGRARAMELGANMVTDLSGEDTGALADRLRQAADGRVDLVLDPVWGRPAEAALQVLSPRGRLVNLGSAAGAGASLSSAALRGGELSVLGYTNNALTNEQKATALNEILTHAAAGQLTADRETVPLDHAADAWSRCGQAPHRRGVLIP